MPLNDRNIEDVAIYIGLSSITKGLSISPLKLQKLLYYTQSWFMVFLGRENTLFKDIPQAWVNGPVYPVIYHKYKDKTQNMCDHLDRSVFSEGDSVDGLQDAASKLDLNSDQLELLESIIMLYGKQTQNQLIWLTHSEQPWAEAREGFAPFERSEKELSLDTMYNFYSIRYHRNRRNNEA